MFLFYHNAQTEENISYYKGLLFESLLEDYLKNLGYVIKLRKKNNSLEYDIEGINKTTDRKIFGEAKAFNKNIAAQILSAFVGKLMPLGIIDNKINGVFLSTSPLTAEADEYYRSISKFGIKCITGKELFNSIFENLNLPKKETLWNKIKNDELELQSNFLLKTNLGIFIVLITGTTNSVTPTFFTLFNSNGVIVKDNKYLNELLENIKELSSLTPFIPSQPIQTINTEKRTIPKGLIVGTSWTDYRLPAGPSFYIGRNDLIEQIINNIKKSTESNILQIKSRSGVGKSSTLALVEKKLKAQGFSTELHDSRDIKSVLDFKATIRRFIKSKTTPQDMREVDEMLSEFVKKLNNKKAIFIVDQFESTFNNPEIFESYEALATLFLKYKENLIFCLARKNDQLTTYDESKITLERFNNISKHYVLKDFSKKEAAKLIENINKYSSSSVGTDILSYVLEFAQGFPWLLKRTMAHIIKLSSQPNIPQNELFATGLKLDDLFEEELEELDEIEKEYLYKISARLPSDYQQLQRIFDEDPLLPNILDRLTRSRLLRMTGATYDTYNDVFKEYLVYHKLPDFRQSIIYRKLPNSVISSFLSIIDKESFKIEELENILNTGRGAVFNNIKEWRNISLIEKSGEIWSIPNKVMDAYSKKNLGEYIRKQVLNNDIVVRLLNILNKNSIFALDDLTPFLKEQFPFVEASNQTWELYANILKSWLVNFSIVIIDDNIIKPIQITREEVLHTLGNIDNIKFSKRGNHEIYLPSVSWKHIEECYYDIMSGKIPQKGEKLKALYDLKKGEWYTNGKFIHKDITSFKSEVKEMLLSDTYNSIWEAAEKKKPLLPILKEIIEIDFSEETMKWRLKKLINWGKAFGIIENKRYKY